MLVVHEGAWPEIAKLWLLFWSYVSFVKLIAMHVCAITNHTYRNRLDTLTWDQENELELGNFGPSSKGHVQSNTLA